MEYISELHVHSRYAGACSEQLTLENIDAAAKTKGINIIGTGDFTHPEWFKQMKSLLVPKGNGLFSIKDSKTGVSFIISGEVCTIFPKNGKGNSGMFDRTGNVAKIHHGLLLPDIEAAGQINDILSKKGNLSIDGRPQFNMRASEFVETVMGVSKEIFVFAAHCWTPWFGALGSMGGFNSLEEAYEDQAKHVRALETGLSSDPAMNWRVSKLDRFALISGGDAHSLPKLGREATVLDFEKPPSYLEITDQIKQKKFKCTIEFYPEEGKYHFDGHRKCNVSFSPEESAKYNNICPVCRGKLTLGVVNRVNQLADREPGYALKGSPPFVHAIPLDEVISHVSGKGVQSGYVRSIYDKLVEKFGSEFDVLLKAKTEDIAAIDRGIAAAIENVRADRVKIKPGYDGVFGVIDIADSSDPASRQKHSFGQKTIGGF